MSLKCAVCYYVADDDEEAKDAIIVVAGLSLCEDHQHVGSDKALNHAILEERGYLRGYLKDSQI